MDDSVACGHYFSGALTILLFLVCIVPGMASITPDFFIKNQAGMVDVQFPVGDSLVLYDNSTSQNEEIVLWNWTVTNGTVGWSRNSLSKDFPLIDSNEFSAGTYTVSLQVIGTVTNNPPPAPAIGTFTLTNDAGIVADFTSSVNYETIPPTLNLIDLSTSSKGMVNRWYWHYLSKDNEIYSTVRSPSFPIPINVPPPELPISFGMLVDYSGSMNETNINESKDALCYFVNISASKDRIAILKFDDYVDIIQNLTGDKQLLLDKIDAMPNISGGWTAFYDAIYEGVNLLSNERDLKAIIGFTDGVSNSDVHTLNETIQYAQVNNIPIYTVGMGDSVDPKILSRISQQTGGRYYYAPDSSVLASIYAQIYNTVNTGSRTVIVNLTIVDDSGNKKSTSQVINTDKERNEDGITFSFGQESGFSPFEIKFVPEQIGTDWNISWDYGDGYSDYYSIDDETTWNWSPYHTFPSTTNSTDAYYVTMTADKGGRIKIVSNYVEVVPYSDTLPEPSISVDPAEAGSAPGVPVNTPIIFSCVNYIYSSWEDSWLWDFGDGTSSPLHTPTHSYTTPGIYDVKLRASNLHGETPDSIQVFISNSATIIDANAIPVSGDFPLTVSFTANASVNGKTAAESEKLIKEWTWDFGEMDEAGSPILSTDHNPVHIYNLPGIYQASVFCTLYDGSISDTYILTTPIVVGPDPYADFYWEAIATDDSSSHYGYKFTDKSMSLSNISYLWDFNDGYYSDEQNPTHIYREPGVYDVTLTVTSELGSSTKTETIVVTPEGNPATVISGSGFQDAGFTYVMDNLSSSSTSYVPLVAKFLVNGQKVPAPVSSPSSVTFTDLSTGWPTSWLWDFGDGQSSNLQNPVHTYAYPGRYIPKLTISNQAGYIADYTLPGEIVVQYGEPVITAEANITQGMYPLAVQFTASATVDGFDVASSKDIIKEWTWVFGELDGSGHYAVSHEQNPVYVYEKPGLYPVNVTCTLQDGVSKTVDIPITNGVIIPGSSNIITVNPLPLANYYWEYLDYDESCCYLVKFTDASVTNSANDPHSRLWVFDDGSQSTATNPTHRFKEAGNYNVSLTVSDVNGNMNSSVKTVPITDGYGQPDNPRSYDLLTADFQTVVGKNSKSINFIDTTTGTVTQWVWNFGDGNSAVITGTSGDAVHTYQKFGSYDVTLTASNPIYSDSVSKSIGIR